MEGRRHTSIVNRENGEDRLDRAGGTKEMAGRGFGRGHRDLGSGVAEQPLDRTELALVAERWRVAGGVDVVEIGCREAGALERCRHAAEAAIAIGRRRG